jgi:hypothetical protein
MRETTFEAVMDANDKEIESRGQVLADLRAEVESLKEENAALHATVIAYRTQHEDDTRQFARMARENAALKQRLDKYESGHCIRCLRYAAEVCKCKNFRFAVPVTPLDSCGAFKERGKP